MHVQGHSCLQMSLVRISTDTLPKQCQLSGPRAAVLCYTKYSGPFKTTLRFSIQAKD